MSTRYYTVVASPIGDLMLVSDGVALCQLSMLPHPDPEREGWVADASKLAEAARQLAEYFAGQRREFELPLAPGGTDFQLKVWQALREIPFGQTESYGKLAERIGQPAASRAVGAANGRNPIAVIVPCHRVIGSKGTLTGFGGGLDRKSWLLAHEGAAFKPNPVRRERSVRPELTESAKDSEPGEGLATEFEAAGRNGALAPNSESSPVLASVD